MFSTVQKIWIQVWDPLVQYRHWALIVVAVRGPLASARGLVIVGAYAEEHEGRSEGGGGRSREGGAGIAGDLHGALADITLGLIILHILGVGLASVAHRENLVAGMFSGGKRSKNDG